MPWMLRRGGHLPQWWTSGSWMSRCWTPISVSHHPNSSTRQYFSPPNKKQINVTNIFFLQNITNSLLTTLFFLFFSYPFCVRYSAFTSFSDYLYQNYIQIFWLQFHQFLLGFFLFMSVHVFRYSPTFASTLDRSVLMAWAWLISKAYSSL